MVVAFWILVGVLVGIVSNVVLWALLLNAIDGDEKGKEMATSLIWCLIPFLMTSFVLCVCVGIAIDDKKRRKRV